MTNRTQLRIRRASAADTHAIADIGVRSWQAAYRGILPADFLAGLLVAPREVAWRSLLESNEDGEAPAWVVQVDGRAAGFVASGPPRDADVPLPAAEVYAIYVLPEAWRRGAGRILMTTAQDHWRALGSAELVLWVLESNINGRAFYEALGWGPDGARQEIDFGAFKAGEVRYRTRL
jgi:GNAT superfamily N-acetyltransferase